MLGQYELLQEIGSGSFGKLFKAECQGKKVALKTVHRGLLRSSRTTSNPCWNWSSASCRR